MKFLVLALGLFLSILTADAQEHPAFPGAFVGHWSGTLNWYTNGASEPRKVNMELHIQPSKDSLHQYTWHIIYGKPSEDSRPYILKAADTTKGHWVIDEKNGIILDQYWKGGKFSGAFSVGGTTILNSYWLENGALHMEFYSYPAKAITTTGNGTEESPKVDSYHIKSYQQAVLRRK
ncbi:hypothetical protein [Pseudobacter ginsenosidimutans]|jgi:hypothetical protein|uniref:Lipocalin-like protein n=1 Tax=Pseudobacter ginsenosidimutans TaxID=661488 RepID=A0A4V2F0R4_9BACT|nr:hypothetical protein [Pseudobacter ginsenosidimutans]QEC42119.1 hypothetical protein FSB84_10620 [Pseudobacter ginsenosidimutans]RZS71041.1 hypothetical protein EV199_2942 [Pseudobacter ginsenosidimutans]